MGRRPVTGTDLTEIEKKASRHRYTYIILPYVGGNLIIFPSSAKIGELRQIALKLNQIKTERGRDNYLDRITTTYYRKLSDLGVSFDMAHRELSRLKKSILNQAESLNQSCGISLHSHEKQ